MAGVITASEPSWIAPFTGLSPRAFGKLVTVMRRAGADAVRKGRPLTGNRNDCKAWEESGAKAAVGSTLTIADGGYPGAGLVMPHRRRKGEDLPEWKQAHNKSHKQVRARVEHAFARMKTWKILRDCRLKGDGVHHAMLGIARMHNLALAG
ncbi:transposase [Streptomyces sp. NBC_00996]|uniref:transposase n=1 Tax=Streptomyces sp. NBC_00996 TaxID=2903710 RepID=UPI00386F3768|nr:transposase [Streptomyces sp. NBC_00996]